MSIELNCNLLVKFRFLPANYSILIVESCDSVNNTIKRLLTQIGYKCFSACNFDDAKNIMEVKNINYILLDMTLANNTSEKLLSIIEQTDKKVFTFLKETSSQLLDLPYHKNIVDFIIKDKDLFYKMDFISKSIEKLEKNKLKTILIVSESKSVQSEVSQILSNKNYNLIIEENLHNVLKIVEQNVISLIFLDLELETSDTISFLQNSKNELMMKENIPVMVLSNPINISSRKTIINTGVIEIFSKPFLPEELIMKVDLVIDHRRKIDEVVCSTTLLSEYKDAVDERSIVSKTSPNGIITFVNKQFCTLSGYSEDELIGKNHNIVRHPDMDGEAFRDLWYTIKVLKRTWRGKVKNRKKDGGFYWVDALIKPIIDKKGDIVEFIGLRNDITEIETYKDILKDKLTDTSKSLNDNISYTAQYEEAISKFTAVMKTDTNHKITFVNEEFTKISGYSKKELIGKSCESLRHENHIISNDAKRIDAALSKNEHIEITFTNIAKDGSIYFVDTIAYPIANAKGEIVEYLHLMHDVSELTSLHKEIEDTQKEIVYKMGEIGESRSKETGNHVKRVAEYSKSLALLYGLSLEDANTLFTASPMHDIGKVAISDSILKKPARLTDEEFRTMQTHTTIGYDILKGSSREVLKAAAIVANEHHEKWNGQGYPQGLKGYGIHVYGRITAMADVFDALGSDRCYKKAWDDEKIFSFFKEQRAEQFDPDLVDIFLANKEIFLEIRNKYKDSL